MKEEVLERLNIVKKGKTPSGYMAKKSGIYPEGWNENSIEEVCDLVDYRGKTPTKTEKGIFLLTAKNIKKGNIDYESSKEYISPDEYEEVMRRGVPKKGDVVFTTEAPLGNVAQIDNEKIAIAQRVLKLRGKKNAILNDYLKQLLLSGNFQSELDKESTGSTVKGIKGARFKKLKIVYPKMFEQQKIATILSTWDRTIHLKEKLIEEKTFQKKGLLKRLLTGEIRLRGFEGEWEEVRLGDIFERVTRKNNENNTNVLTISAQRGLINQKDFFNKTIASSNLDNYFLIRKGEFAYNKSYSNGYPMGAIKRLNLYEAGVVTTLYICFELIEELHDNATFYEHYFESGLLIEQLTQIAHEGGRAHGLLNVSPGDFFNLRLPRPSLKEQNRLSEIFTTVCMQIELLEKELEAIKVQKKGLMQLLLTGIVRVNALEN